MTDLPAAASPVDPSSTAEDSASAVGSGWTVSTWPAALIVGACSTGIAWLRMPVDVSGQLYAEDGRTFFGDWFTHGGWSLLIEPYAGYQHLVPRVTSWMIRTVFPVEWWATATNLAACSIVGAVAGLVFFFSRDVTSFWPARVALGLLTAVAPIVGFEALGNLANLHWFLLYLSVWVLLATPRSMVGAWAMGVVALLCTATEPQCAMFLPLAVWAVFRSRRSWPVVLCWTVGVVAQVATTLIAPRAIAVDYPPLLSTVEGYVLNVGMTLGSISPDILGLVLVRTSWWIGSIGVLLVLASAVLGAVWGECRERVAILALLYGSIVSWTASFVLGANPNFFYSEMTPEQLGEPLLIRWGTAAGLMLGATLFVAGGVAARRRPEWRRGAFAAIGLIVIVMAANLAGAEPAAPDSWGTSVDESAATCSDNPDAVIDVTTPPGPEWAVPLPCSVLEE